jgi:hypothetical protein
MSRVTAVCSLGRDVVLYSNHSPGPEPKTLIDELGGLVRVLLTDLAPSQMSSGISRPPSLESMKSPSAATRAESSRRRRAIPDRRVCDVAMSVLYRHFGDGWLDVDT